MQIWADTDINRFALEAENEIASDVPCINKRVALSIVAGTGTYTLASEIVSIRRVTWRGKKMTPMPFFNFTDYRITTTTPAGTPYQYFYNGFGENNLRFYPIPNVSIASASSNLYGSEIPNRVIVEYWALPDTTITAQRVPVWVRRRLIRDFVLYKCFAMEGLGQNLAASEYFKYKYDTNLQLLKQIINGLYFANPSTLDDSHERMILPRPVLPWKYVGF